MPKAIALLFTLSVLMLTVHLIAQQPDNGQSKVRLLESPGPIPTLYVPQAEKRALRIQKAMQAANTWYEKQLHLHVPVTLYILDKDMWQRFNIGSSYGMPTSIMGRGIVAIGEEESKNIAEIIRAQGRQPTDREVSKLASDWVTFHELGHHFSVPLKIRSGNQFVNELVAGIFYVAYIRAERPDLDLTPADTFPAGTSPRYTSLADLDYLYTEVGDQNYYWFQHQLEHLADFLVKDQSFPAIIEKLQAAFPADKAKHETLEEIDAHLETIRPGFIKMAGPLAGPSTITRVKPSACQDTSEKAGSTTIILIQNNTGDPITVTKPTGGKSTIAPHTFSTNLVIGTFLKLPDGTCLIGRDDEPTLAVIEKQ